MKLSNHKPGAIDPARAAASPAGVLDAGAVWRNIVEDACFQPLVAGTAVTATVNGQDVTADDIAAQMMAMAASANVDPLLEASLDGMLSHMLASYTPSSGLSVDEAFVNQAATAQGLDFPDAMTVYTPAADVIPTAKGVLAGTVDPDQWTCVLSFAFRPSTLVASFADDAAFGRFKAWVRNEVATVASALPPDTVRLFSDFDGLSLDQLTESITIRKDASDNNHEMGFARMLHHYMLCYLSVEQPPLYMLNPVSLSQLVVPETVVFVNISEHAHATPRQIRDEWEIIAKSLAMPVRLVSMKQLQKLTTAARSAKKMAGAAATAHMAQPDVRSAKVPFRKTAPTSMDLAKIVAKILKKMTSVAHSQNSYRDVHRSYMRASRRNPDDYNVPGKSVTTRYKPDIHLYIDTSGSISERNYQDMVKACIQMARKLDVNVYFNSFSHMLSECVLLPTKGRSVKQIYTQFQKVPKVGGGTDYEQIWNYVNASRKRRRELSLIITDFEYTAPRQFVKHPKNLFYVPCSNMDWRSITHYAESFCRSAAHIDPAIRSHLLF